MGYSLSMKKIFYLIFFASFFVIALSTFSSKALAGSCTISSGNTDDFEGLIVHVAVLNNNGTINSIPATTGYTMGLSSNANGGTGGDAGIRHVDQYKNIQESYSEAMFSPVTSECTDKYGVDSYNKGDMVLDYGVSSNNVSAIPTPKDNDTGWVLGCGTSSDPHSNNGEGRLFTVKMNGNPTGTVPGGTWLYSYNGQATPTTGKFTWSLADKDQGGINGLTMQFNAVYVPPKLNIKGTVYSAANEKLKGVQITGTNVTAGLKTDSYGSFDFDILAGASFSIRATDPFTSKDGHQHSGVKITPFDSTVTKCNNNSTSYELQVAGTPNSNGTCDYGLKGNSGYDFHYTKEKYAKINVSGTVAPSRAYPGTTVDFSGKAAVSEALSDDGEDTYRITITPSIAPPNSGDKTTFNASCDASSTQKLYLNASSSSKSLPCQIKIPAGSTAGTQYCVTTSVATAHDYVDITGDNLIKDITGYHLIKCVKVLAPPTISLGAAPSHEIGNGLPANITYTVDCKDFVGTLTYSISVSSTPMSTPRPTSVAAKTFNCITAHATYPGTISNTATSLDGILPNNYTYSPSITAAAGVPNLPISGTAVILDNYTVPYARFYGADIMSQGDNGAIVFNANSLTSATGSASQYAAVAKQTITLATAAFRSGAVNTLTTKISASPNISSSNNTSGGTWGNNNWSTSGYFGDITKDQHVSVPTGVNGATGKITVVGANIYIDGNITISTTNLPPPSGSAIFNDVFIPSLVFITPGNIYISANVSRIDASLQAGGNIFTCASGSAVASGSNCQTPLTVNGSVGAGGSIKFNRSCGTRLKNPKNEDSAINGGLIITTRSCTISGGGAAEVFNFPNYLYFTSSTGSSASRTQFQSIYSAPPLL